MMLLKKSLVGAAALCLTVPGLSLSARAQTPAAAGVVLPMAHLLVAPKPVPALAFKKTPVTQIVDAIAKASGTTIVTNSLIAAMRVDFTTIGGSLDNVLVQLGAALPPSGTVRAVLLPTFLAPGAMPDGDAVVTYLTAQDALSKPAVSPAKGVVVSGSVTVPPSFAPGEFEALGRRLPAEKAAALSTEMNLTPVYLVSINRPPADPVAKLSALQAETLRNYQSMTPDQRKQAMEQQFNDMMNMDKGARQALLGQMMDQGSYMMNMMKNMPPAQMQEFNSEIMSAMQNSGMLGAMGGGAAGKGGATGK